MSNMTRSQARVIDPVLTNVALGYSNPDYVGMKLFPRVEVPTSGGKVIKFGKEAFLRYNLNRAPGAKKARVQFGYAADSISLTQDSLEGKVPREYLRDGAIVPHVDQEASAVRKTMDIVLRSLEIEQASIAQNTANYDANHRVALAGTDRWDNSASIPRNVINAGREAIRRSIGAYPNVLEIPPKAFNSLADHDLLKEQFKYTQKESLTTAMLAAYFGVQEVFVGQSVYAETEASEFTDVWSSAVLAYVPRAERDIDTPSYGYTYVYPGHPLAEESYFDKSVNSWIYPVEMERRPYVTSMAAGYLIQTPTS